MFTDARNVAPTVDTLLEPARDTVAAEEAVRPPTMRRQANIASSLLIRNKGTPVLIERMGCNIDEIV